MTSHEIIINLIKQFPYFFERIPQGITNDFDAPTFDHWASSTPLSLSEDILCQFILMVWDWRKEWKTGSFNIGQAFSVLGAENKAVIKQWCQEPFLL